MIKKNKDLRLSFSLANQFYRFMTMPNPFPNIQEDILKSLHGIPSDTSLAMLIGKKIHRIFEEETNKTGLPPSCLGMDVGQGKAEARIEKRLSDWCVFSGVKDFTTEDGKQVIDYKVGMGETSSYLRSHQKGCYKLLDDALELFTVVKVNPFVEYPPVHLIPHYCKDNDAPALSEYIQPLLKLQSEKEYKPSYFYYHSGIKTEYGDKLKNDALDTELTNLAKYLYENIDNDQIEIIGEYLDDSVVEDTAEWLFTIAGEIRNHCENSNIPYWRLFDRETGDKIS